MEFPKTLPVNYEAEKGVLSCLFLDQSFMRESKLTKDHFHNGRLGEMFEIMRSIKNDGKKYDEVIVGEKFGDQDFVYEVSATSMSSVQYKEYEEIVVNNYIYRKIIELAEDVAVNCHNKKDIDLIKSKAQGFMDIGIGRVRRETLIAGSIETAFKLEQGTSTKMICPYGFTELDKLLRGYKRGCLTVVGARPSVGKSTFLLNLCVNALEENKKTVFFSTEMPAEEIQTRFLCIKAKVPQRKLEKGDKQALEKVAKASESFNKEVDCVIYDSFGDFQNMVSLIRKEATLGAEIVYIDYLQQIQNSTKHSLMTHIIGEMTTKLKSVAIDLGIEIVIASQLNRDSTSSVDKEPKLSQLRESGNIEQDVDVAILLHDEKIYDKHDQSDGLKAIVAKNRHGPKGEFMIFFERVFYLMTDI